MSEHRGLIRKVIYVCGIAVLLVPLSILSRPETTESGGGLLAQMRHDYGLSQSNLGDIDPAGETMKLATLGMRGVAANLLWYKANEYKKTEDWTSFSAALEQITRLQPNFITVWRFQAWNLSYNVSVEFDDYHDRYYWVTRGIKFLEGGTRYNRQEPRLLWDLGWFIAQKIGRADEHKQYRALFREDDDFHGNRPRGEARDNWLVGQERFLEAVQMVDNGIPLKGMSPLVFFSDPSMCQINYSEAIEDEGRFDEVAKFAWMKGADDWQAFGNREMESAFGQKMHLNDGEHFEQVVREAKQQLDKLVPPELPEQIKQEKLATLTKQEREALDTEPEKHTEEQRQLMYLVTEKIAVKPSDLADHIHGEQRAEALRLADTLTQAESMIDTIERYRDIVNFKFWRLRCQVEKTDEALQARKLIYQADEAKANAYLDQAQPLYEQGFAKWREVFDKFPDMVKESTFTEDLVESVDRYFEVLRKLGGQIPEKFILQDVLDTDPKHHQQAR